MTPVLRWAAKKSHKKEEEKERKKKKMDSHFNVLLIVSDKVTRQCLQTTTFLKRRESRSGIEPRPFCLPAA